MTKILHNQALFAHARLALHAGHTFARGTSTLRLGPSGQARPPTRVGKSFVSDTIRKLRAAATEHMTMRENPPERVKKYFGDKHVAYAAS